MSELYGNLEKFRDESYAKIKSSEGDDRRQHVEDFENAKPVLSQLMELAFFNESKPGTLPDVFEIHNVKYITEEFEAFMKTIGYDVEADMTSRTWNSGIASFKVTMVQK